MVSHPTPSTPSNADDTGPEDNAQRICIFSEWQPTDTEERTAVDCGLITQTGRTGVQCEILADVKDSTSSTHSASIRAQQAMEPSPNSSSHNEPPTGEALTPRHILALKSRSRREEFARRLQTEAESRDHLERVGVLEEQAPGFQPLGRQRFLCEGRYEGAVAPLPGRAEERLRCWDCLPTGCYAVAAGSACGGTINYARQSGSARGEVTRAAEQEEEYVVLPSSKLPGTWPESMDTSTIHPASFQCPCLPMAPKDQTKPMSLAGKDLLDFKARNSEKDSDPLLSEASIDATVDSASASGKEAARYDSDSTAAQRTKHPRLEGACNPMVISGLRLNPPHLPWETSQHQKPVSMQPRNDCIPALYSSRCYQQGTPKPEGQRQSPSDEVPKATFSEPITCSRVDSDNYLSRLNPSFPTPGNQYPPFQADHQVHSAARPDMSLENNITPRSANSPWSAAVPRSKGLTFGYHDYGGQIYPSGKTWLPENGREEKPEVKAKLVPAYHTSTLESTHERPAALIEMGERNAGRLGFMDCSLEQENLEAYSSQQSHLKQESAEDKDYRMSEATNNALEEKNEARVDRERSKAARQQLVLRRYLEMADVHAREVKLQRELEQQKQLAMRNIMAYHAGCSSSTYLQEQKRNEDKRQIPECATRPVCGKVGELDGAEREPELGVYDIPRRMANAKLALERRLQLIHDNAELCQEEKVAQREQVEAEYARKIEILLIYYCTPANLIAASEAGGNHGLEVNSPDDNATIVAPFRYTDKDLNSMQAFPSEVHDETFSMNHGNSQNLVQNAEKDQGDSARYVSDSADRYDSDSEKMKCSKAVMRRKSHVDQNVTQDIESTTEQHFDDMYDASVSDVDDRYGMKKGYESKTKQGFTELKSTFEDYDSEEAPSVIADDTVVEEEEASTAKGDWGKYPEHQDNNGSVTIYGSQELSSTFEGDDSWVSPVSHEDVVLEEEQASTGEEAFKEYAVNWDAGIPLIMNGSQELSSTFEEDDSWVSPVSYEDGVPEEEEASTAKGDWGEYAGRWDGDEPAIVYGSEELEEEDDSWVSSVSHEDGVPEEEEEASTAEGYWGKYTERWDGDGPAIVYGSEELGEEDDSWVSPVSYKDGVPEEEEASTAKGYWGKYTERWDGDGPTIVYGSEELEGEEDSWKSPVSHEDGVPEEEEEASTAEGYWGKYTERWDGDRPAIMYGSEELGEEDDSWVSLVSYKDGVPEEEEASTAKGYWGKYTERWDGDGPTIIYGSEELEGEEDSWESLVSHEDGVPEEEEEASTAEGYWGKYTERWDGDGPAIVYGSEELEEEDDSWVSPVSHEDGVPEEEEAAASTGERTWAGNDTWLTSVRHEDVVQEEEEEEEEAAASTREEASEECAVNWDGDKPASTGEDTWGEDAEYWDDNEPASTGEDTWGEDAEYWDDNEPASTGEDTWGEDAEYWDDDEPAVVEGSQVIMAEEVEELAAVEGEAEIASAEEEVGAEVEDDGWEPVSLDQGHEDNGSRSFGWW